MDTLTGFHVVVWHFRKVAGGCRYVWLIPCIRGPIAFYPHAQRGMQMLAKPLRVGRTVNKKWRDVIWAAGNNQTACHSPLAFTSTETCCSLWCCCCSMRRNSLIFCLHICLKMSSGAFTCFSSEQFRVALFQSIHDYILSALFYFHLWHYTITNVLLPFTAAQRSHVKQGAQHNDAFSFWFSCHKSVFVFFSFSHNGCCCAYWLPNCCGVYSKQSITSITLEEKPNRPWMFTTKDWKLAEHKFVIFLPPSVFTECHFSMDNKILTINYTFDWFKMNAELNADSVFLQNTPVSNLPLRCVLACYYSFSLFHCSPSASVLCPPTCFLSFS